MEQLHEALFKDDDNRIAGYVQCAGFADSALNNTHMVKLFTNFDRIMGLFIQEPTAVTDPLELPEEVPTDHMRNLITLGLARTKLSRLPAFLGALKQLRTLYIVDNPRLGEISPVIRKMSGLLGIFLTNTGISSVPTWIHELHELRQFSANRNILVEFPLGLTKLTNLFALSINVEKPNSVDSSRPRKSAITHIIGLGR